VKANNRFIRQSAGVSVLTEDQLANAQRLEQS
jgi:hypothetical protein